MRAQGYSPEVVTGYRISEKQQRLLNEKIEVYRNDGCAFKMAESLAELSVAKPGTSEHQLGIAIDINKNCVDKTRDEFYLWLGLNAYKHGFIKRYPADKTDFTEKMSRGITDMSARLQRKYIIVAGYANISKAWINKNRLRS